MPFGFIRVFAVVRSLLAIPAEIAGLRQDVRSLQAAEVQTMATEDQIEADIATIKSGIATMAANYQAAGLALQTQALANAKASWDVASEADQGKIFEGLHAELTGIITTMSAGQPITPPATSDNPSPAPVAAPATDGSAATPSTDQAATAAPASTLAPAAS